MRAVAVAYGITFVSGLVLAFAGITPQTHHVAYPLLAVLTSAVGVALALRVADTARLSYLIPTIHSDAQKRLARDSPLSSVSHSLPHATYHYLSHGSLDTSPRTA